MAWIIELGHSSLNRSLGAPSGVDRYNSTPSEVAVGPFLGGPSVASERLAGSMLLLRTETAYLGVFRIAWSKAVQVCGTQEAQLRN
jgi:hypothetical protein